MLASAIRVMLLWGVALSAWALESVSAVDRAMAQLIEDGSALEQAVSRQAGQQVSLADLRLLAARLDRYEQVLAQTARQVQLSPDVMSQPGYDQLLNESIQLSQLSVNLARGIERLASRAEADSSEQYRNTLETMVRAMLRLSDDIGVMADRILFTEEQIGIMADRIGEMADRILETQRIQNENIARVHETANRLIDRLALDVPRMDEAYRDATVRQREMVQQQRELQQQMQEMRAQQQASQEQLQQMRGF